MSKGAALAFAKEMAPLYAGMLNELQSNGGRFSFESEYAELQIKLGAYVRLYEDERLVGTAVGIGIFGEQGFKDFDRGLKELPESEQAAAMDDLVNDPDLRQLAEKIELPKTPEDMGKAAKLIAAFDPSEQAAMTKQGILLFGGIFSGFFNLLSLMVHGVKLTALVPQAIKGSNRAFFKAVQIDRLLLTHHPYFMERKRKAQDDGEIGFLKSLAYRENNPPIRGKIEHPALYVLFGLLDAVGWLNELKHNEILALCDAANLDRYQEPISDVPALTKKLLTYRKFQKTGK